MPEWLQATAILDSLGGWALWGAAAMIFAECGLLIGVIFPGESMLFTIGLLKQQELVTQPLVVICSVLTAAAFLGNALGYEIGRKAGPALFARPDSRIFKQQHLIRSQQFFTRYGARAIVLARFVPLVRTFITVTAGASHVPRRTFLTFSALGAVLWASGVTLLGYGLGGIPVVRDNVELGLAVLVVLVLVPMIIEYRRTRTKR